MSFDPTSIISLIQNCKTLYDYFKDVKHSSKERRRLLDEVHSLQPELEALQRLANTPGVAGDPASMDRLAQLLDPSQPFAKVVDGTLGRIRDVLTYGTSNPNATRFKILGKRLVAALSWTADKAEVKDLLWDLERYKSRIGLALQHDMFKKQDVMDGKLDTVEEYVSNEVRLRTAEFISKNDYSNGCKQLLEKKLPGTGMWMIQHSTFVAWRDDRESPKTLWCHGHPGAGKSVMAALVIDHLQSTLNNIVLSVFCRYSSNIFTSSFGVLDGLLRQLIEKARMVPHSICSLYWSRTNPNPSEPTRILLAGMAASDGRPIYIVVDALDECPFALDLLRDLHWLQDLGSSFRVLITSRPVFSEIEDYPSIEIRASDHDILVAVEATLPKLKGTWLDDALKNTIRAKIVQKADGMFLLASLQLRELERDVTCRRDVTAILDSLPRTLADVYQLTFRRIREQGERTNKLVCRALAILALRSIHLHTKHVQHLLAEGDVTQYPDIETILQCCHGLVRKTTNDHDFEFIHYSVHEYTTTHWSELFPENSNSSDVCLRLGYSVLTSPDDESWLYMEAWDSIVFRMRVPEEFQQLIFFLSTPAARASLVKARPTLASLIHDPLLIACGCLYWHLMEYMIQTEPPDVQRFTEALRVSESVGWYGFAFVERINARPDMRVNSRGRVVAVNLDEGDENPSDPEDDEAIAWSTGSSFLTRAWGGTRTEDEGEIPFGNLEYPELNFLEAEIS